MFNTWNYIIMELNLSQDGIHLVVIDLGFYYKTNLISTWLFLLSMLYLFYLPSLFRSMFIIVLCRLPVFHFQVVSFSFPWFLFFISLYCVRNISTVIYVNKEKKHVHIVKEIFHCIYPVVCHRIIPENKLVSVSVIFRSGQWNFK